MPEEKLPENRIDISEECEIDWREYLTEWLDKIYPIFKEKGFTQDAALQVWFTNRNILNTAEMADMLKKIYNSGESEDYGKER